MTDNIKEKDKPEILSVLSGFNVLLMGPAGTGKTHSIGTLVDTGLEVFYLTLESGYESLSGYYTDKGKPIPANLHYAKVEPPKADFSALMKAATRVNTMNLDILSKAVDPDKSKYNQFILLLSALNNFIDSRTGESFGAVNTWGTDRVLVIDGLTGICQAALSLVIGGKPVKNQADWGIAQDQVERLLRMICDNCECHFVLLGHVERETDAIMGGVKLMISAIGRALGPKIPAMFSDVILAVRAGSKWTWDTASAQADVKTRNLTISASNLPDFGVIVSKWKSRKG